MAAQTEPAPAPAPATVARTVIVVDRDLPKGLAANAAAVLAHGFGARAPELVGPDFADAAGAAHVGLIPTGVPILGAATAELGTLRDAAASEPGLLVVDLPTAAHQTNDYDVFRAVVASTAPAALSYLAVLVSGPPKVVRRLTGSLGLLR